MDIRKVLLIEDDINDRKLVHSILKNHKFYIIIPENKTNGMEKMKSEVPDLVILGISKKSQFENFEIVKEMKKNTLLKKIPVLILSSINVLTTSDNTKEDIQKIIADFRLRPEIKDMPVLLVKHSTYNKLGIDYQDQHGNSGYFEVDGFLNKPINEMSLLAEVERIL